jgi:hypothetical protein
VAAEVLGDGRVAVPNDPFVPGSENSNDADVGLLLDGGRKLWLDVLSVELSGPGTFTSLTRNQTIAQLVKRSRRKYRDKFKQAVASALPPGSSVGESLRPAVPEVRWVRPTLANDPC